MDDKMKLRRRIAAYDFAILDMETYLDTHPDDTRAMQMRAIYEAKRGELVAAYEARFGPYVVTRRDVQGDCWTWVDDPWPWDYQKEG